MYPIAYVREHADAVKAGLVARHREPGEVDQILALDAQWREAGHRINTLRAQRNAASQTIAKAGAGASPEDRERLGELRQQIVRFESELAGVESQRDAALLNLPQIPHASVPIGKTADDNALVSETPKRPAGGVHPRTHFDIGHALNLLDEERGVKVAGEGFYALWGDLARLEQALIQYMRELHEARGFLEVVPPILINSAAMTGTGQLPKFAEDAYHVERDDLWLAPTAEVPVTNLFRDEVFLPEDLPLRLMAYTPCFRREASGHGVETRGIVRVHQFDKVELVVFSTPDRSYEELEALRAAAEAVITGLKLPYRVVSLCTGELPDKAAKCYDLELWAPGQERWLEVSSVSNFEAYQANRANLRWRPTPGAKAEAVHTLNGSGTALPRLLVSILENYQTADGAVEIPDVLRPKMGGRSTLRPNPLVGERELARGRRPAPARPVEPKAES